MFQKYRLERKEGMEKIMKIQRGHSGQGALYRNNVLVFVNDTIPQVPRYKQRNLA
jgi:hypothetical protein